MIAKSSSMVPRSGDGRVQICGSSGAFSLSMVSFHVSTHEHLFQDVFIFRDFMVKKQAKILTGLL